ncbi:DUF2339 domain-containing protein [Flavitalea flava]
METLVVLFFIVLIFLIVSFRTKTLGRMDDLEREIRNLKQVIKTQGQVPVQPHASTPSGQPVKPEPPVEQVPSLPSFESVPKPTTVISRPSVPPPPPEPGFFERHPDLEKFIGENLVSKIGIAILVLAIGYFVKYAIDNDWIGPVGRVAVGMLCGGILAGIAHYLRNSYKAFSSILVGGGLAIFYFTIALAYHQYHLFGQTLSFIIMLVITVFAVLLSILYDRQELAIIALAGGFLAPFLVSNGSGNYKVLFGYLLILNSGLLAIAYHKAWRLLNLLAFLLTSLLFVTWMFLLPNNTPASTLRGGFIFATIFYALFFPINIAHNIKENKKFIASDFGILLLNTCIYFGVGLYLLNEMGLGQYRGLFSASMAVINLLTSYILFRKKKVDTNILYLLIGITLSFVSLTAPIQLHGHYITLFWASETVLLYWLFTKSRIPIIRLASFLIWLAMLVSLLMDWTSVYTGDGQLLLPGGGNPHRTILTILFNKGFITGLYTALASFALFLLRKKDAQKKVKVEKEEGVHDRGGFKGITPPLGGWEVAPSVFSVTGILLLFITGALEINYQFTTHYPGSDLPALYLLLYTFTFSYTITMLISRLNWKYPHEFTAGLSAACIVIYLVYLPGTFGIQRDMLEQGHYHVHFFAHWISALLIAGFLYRLIGLQRTEKIKIDDTLAAWILCSLAVIFLSAEIHLLTDQLFYSGSNPLENIQRVYFKTGLPILWGLCSFAFMWLGMRHKFKPLRIISLVLFSVTLLKLFLFDIVNIPVAGKIAAFFCLGVLLLVVSFMYQRLKKIIIEDEEKNKP